MKPAIGVDVGKNSLDVSIDNVINTFSNKSMGYKQLIKVLRKLNAKIDVICCEATGGYEKAFCQYMRNNGYCVHVAHPNKIRHFAKAKGLLAKTDKIDAKIIADYAMVMGVSDNSAFYDEDLEQLQFLMRRREQLQSDKQREMNRLDKPMSSFLRTSIKKHIRHLDQQMNAIDEQLRLQRQAEKIKMRYELLTSVPCIGERVAYCLMAFLPELGHLEDKQLSALVGVAPFNNDSGKHGGKRSIYGGRNVVRRMLYMSAISSIRWNIEMRTFYKKLRAKGKPAKVALVAIVRKLIILLNAVVRRQTKWVEKPQIPT